MIRLPGDWVTQAACGTHPNPDLWFPQGGVHGSGVAEPLRICATCPVKTQCLNEALTEGIEHGIWGGLSPTQRGELLLCVRCGAPAPASKSNRTRVRRYCSAECRYAAAREKLHTRAVPIAIKPQPRRLATCSKCGGRFAQATVGRPALYCSAECRPSFARNNRVRRRAGSTDASS